MHPKSRKKYEVEIQCVLDANREAVHAAIPESLTDSMDEAQIASMAARIDMKALVNLAVELKYEIFQLEKQLAALTPKPAKVPKKPKVVVPQSPGWSAEGGPGAVPDIRLSGRPDPKSRKVQLPPENEGEQA